MRHKLNVCTAQWHFWWLMVVVAVAAGISVVFVIEWVKWSVCVWAQTPKNWSICEFACACTHFSSNWTLNLKWIYNHFGILEGKHNTPKSWQLIIFILWLLFVLFIVPLFHNRGVAGECSIRVLNVRVVVRNAKHIPLYFERRWPKILLAQLHIHLHFVH